MRSFTRCCMVGWRSWKVCRASTCCIETRLPSNVGNVIAMGAAPLSWNDR